MSVPWCNSITNYKVMSTVCAYYILLHSRFAGVHEHIDSKDWPDFSSPIVILEEFEVNLRPTQARTRSSMQTYVTVYTCMQRRYRLIIMAGCNNQLNDLIDQSILIIDYQFNGSKSITHNEAQRSCTCLECAGCLLVSCLMAGKEVGKHQTVYLVKPKGVILIQQVSLISDAN